jgi:hypothetical protein
MRNTALKKAPRISARSHWKNSATFPKHHRWGSLTPNEYLSVEDFWAALTAQSPTTKEIISFN